MLRAEQRGQFDTWMVVQDVCRVSQVGQYRRLIANQADILTFQQIDAIVQQNFYSRANSVVHK
jgi:hypothetical protein